MKAVFIGIVNLILLMPLFSDPERSVDSSSQAINVKTGKVSATIFSVSFLGDNQFLLHILQRVKVSAKRGLKDLLLSH
jgi:hypothetical protein